MPLLEQVDHLRSRFGGRFEAIDRWLASRKDLLVLFCKLSLVPAKRESLPDSGKVAELCNGLVDYISAGHFEIYEQLLAEADHADAAHKTLAKRLYPRIANSTDAILQFTETYGDNEDALVSSQFDNELASLGEILEDRFELEDALIMALFGESAVVA